MALACQRQPTLPHLLQEYGFVEAVAHKMGKKKEKKEAHKHRQRKGTFSNEVEKDLDKELELDEHYSKIVWDMYHLRDYYHNEYSNLLAEKIEKQRREIGERDEKMKHVRENREEEERKESHRVKKRLECHTLETTPKTASVPKSDLYLIVGLEEKMRREGKLKTPSDYSKFRQDMLEPRIFNANFKFPKKTGLTKYSGSSEWLSTHSKNESYDHVFELAPDPQIVEQHTNQLRSSLSRISESRESSGPALTTENWAIAQQFPSQYRSRKSMSNIHQGKQKSDQLLDLEKRFPKHEMPKLHCFTLNLEQKPPDPEEVMQKAEMRAREKGRKRAMRTYTKMYQLAMSNAATTARIMDKFEDLDFVLQGPDLCDVIADHYWMKAYGLQEMLDEISHTPAICQEENSALEVPDANENENIASPETLPQVVSREQSFASNKKGSRKGSGTSKSNKHSPYGELPPVLPLTMDGITGKCNIKETKVISTLWNNYMRAGKSPWMIPDEQ